MLRGQRPVLSDREKQLLELAAQGHIDTSIAHELGISEATVSTYWGRVRVKLGPYSRTELVAMVLKEEGEKAMASLKEENEQLVKRLRLDSGEYKNSSNFYKDLLEVAADAMFVVNEQGVIDNLNDAASKLFGYEKEELLQKPISTLIPERYRMTHDSHRKQYLASPSKKTMGEHTSTVALHKSGKEFTIAATLSALEVESGIAVICVVRAVKLY